MKHSSPALGACLPCECPSRVSLQALGPFVAFDGAVIEDDIHRRGEVHRYTCWDIDRVRATLRNRGIEGSIFATENIESSFRVLVVWQRACFRHKVNGNRGAVHRQSRKQVFDNNDRDVAVCA